MVEEGSRNSPGSFPLTRWSVVMAARSPHREERERALEILTAAYWKPVYKYIRLRWQKDSDQAEDLTQEFFLRLLQKDFLGQYDPQRARLRTFLRVCLDGMICNAEKAAQRLKRGGGARILSLDFEAAEGELQHCNIPSPAAMESFFEREWARSVFTLSVERLRRECEEQGKSIHYRLLELYDIEGAGKDLTYQEVGKQFGLKTAEVTNYLAWARRQLRRVVLEQLRDMTGSEDEFQREKSALLGIERPGRQA